jgi:hypothetical protein
MRLLTSLINKIRSLYLLTHCKVGNHDWQTLVKSHYYYLSWHTKTCRNCGTRKTWLNVSNRIHSQSQASVDHMMSVGRNEISLLTPNEVITTYS